MSTQTTFRKYPDNYHGLPNDEDYQRWLAKRVRTLKRRYAFALLMGPVLAVTLILLWVQFYQHLG